MDALLDTWRSKESLSSWFYCRTIIKSLSSAWQNAHIETLRHVAMCNAMGQDAAAAAWGTRSRGQAGRQPGTQLLPRHASNLMCHQFLPPLQMIFIRQKTQASCKKAEIDRDRGGE